MRNAMQDDHEKARWMLVMVGRGMKGVGATLGVGLLLRGLIGGGWVWLDWGIVLVLIVVGAMLMQMSTFEG